MTDMPEQKPARRLKKRKFIIWGCAFLAVMAIFLAPISPLGPSHAEAKGVPEIPPALLPVFVIGVTAMVLKIRKRFNVE